MDVCQVLNGMQFVCGMRFNGFLVVGVSGWNMMNGSREVVPYGVCQYRLLTTGAVSTRNSCFLDHLS